MAQIWVDGSFNNQTHKAGLGILIRQIIDGGIKETKIQIKTTAIDNNEAELKAIYHALLNIKSLPKDEPLFIITDSQIAIDAITKGTPDKYKELAGNIRGMLCCENWRIYHKKAHTGNKDRYSTRQDISDKLAKKALDNAK